MKELCFSIYKEERDSKICILNFTSEQEKELCRYLMNFRYDFNIMYMDDNGDNCIVFEISPEIEIESYLKDFANKHNADFYKNED